MSIACRCMLVPNPNLIFSALIFLEIMNFRSIYKTIKALSKNKKPRQNNCRGLFKLLSNQRQKLLFSSKPFMLNRCEGIRSTSIVFVHLLRIITYCLEQYLLRLYFTTYPKNIQYKKVQYFLILSEFDFVYKAWARCKRTAPI